MIELGGGTYAERQFNLNLCSCFCWRKEEEGEMRQRGVIFIIFYDCN